MPELKKHQPPMTIEDNNMLIAILGGIVIGLGIGGPLVTIAIHTVKSYC